ncbi:hypothetical protein [Actinomadura geliboluensis]
MLYYAFPVLAQDITRDTGWSTAAMTPSPPDSAHTPACSWY